MPKIHPQKHSNRVSTLKVGTLFLSSVNENKIEKLGKRCDSPGNRIGKIESSQGVVHYENSINIHDSEGAGADKGYDGWNNSPAHSTASSNENLHYSAKAVHGHYIAES